MLVYDLAVNVCAHIAVADGQGLLLPGVGAVVITVAAAGTNDVLTSGSRFVVPQSQGVAACVFRPDRDRAGGAEGCDHRNRQDTGDDLFQDLHSFSSFLLLHECA